MRGATCLRQTSPFDIAVTHYSTNFVDAANVNLRKHRSAGPRSAVPNLGVTCPTLLPVRSTALLQLAIFQHLSLPRMDHLGGLPGAAKQIPNRLPVLHRESESDSVLPSKEKYAPLLVFHDRRVRVEVVALPLAKVPLQIELLQQPSELCDPRVSNHRIPRGKGPRKLQTRGEFIPLFPHQIEAVSAFFQGGQCRLNRKLKILVVCLRRRLLSQGLSVSGIVAARAHLPQGRPMLPKCIVKLLDIRELFLIKKSIEIPHG